MSMKNEYLDQVMQEQAVVAQELKAKRAPARMQQRAAAQAAPMEMQGGGGAHESRGVDVRITGFWRWKTVVVPPNCYVVHTRRGHPKPLHMGLGESFRFNPLLDSFLVVPSSMQTIVINARCICKEKQGVLVQAYVQWIIDDIGTAYKKLDFSDAEDPTRVVNVQLREQAEAAIKDKVTTMGVEEVLSDKQPIIEELTARLTGIVEGKDGGLGLKIVTVQIKEAVVSSPRVWEALQRPFRAEQQRIARVAEIENEKVVEERELRHREEGEISRLSSDEKVARAQHETEQHNYDRAQKEGARRHATEVQARLEKQQREVEVVEQQAELEKQRMIAQAAEIEAKMALEKVVEARAMALVDAEEAKRDRAHAAAHARRVQDLKLDETGQKIRNQISKERVEEKMIEALPNVVEKLPKPEKLIQISGGADGLASIAGLVAGVREVLGKPAS